MILSVGSIVTCVPPGRGLRSRNSVPCGWLAGVDQHAAQARPQRLADRDQVAERAMAGAHQVAKKSTTTISPLKSARVT
jgi:hypothetical protein